MLHVSLLFKYCKKGDGHNVAQPIIIDGGLESEVDGVLHYCIFRGITLYLASFVCFDISKAVWLTTDNLSNSLNELHHYSAYKGK